MDRLAPPPVAVGRLALLLATTLAIAAVAVVVAARPSGPTGLGRVDDPTSPAPPARVVVFGDSLAEESAPALAEALAADRVELRQRTFGGTAPCDWFAQLDDVLAGWQPDLVVASFSGNSLTPCMHGHGQPEALAAKYLDDARRYSMLAAAHGARVLFVSPPARRDAPGLGHPAQLAYARVAKEVPHAAAWTYGGRDVSPGDRYADTLPCGPGDACRDGVVPVRHPDGLHFCPSGAPVTPGVLCDVDSPGARRFATTVADAIRAELRRDP